MRSTEKIDTLNKRILRFILQDYNSPYESLLSKNPNGNNFNFESDFEYSIMRLIAQN